MINSVYLVYQRNNIKYTKSIIMLEKKNDMEFYTI